jgi:hypothetical protein
MVRKWFSNLGPLLVCNIELPKIPQFVIFIILPTKNKKRTSIENSGMRISFYWASIR